MLRSDVNDRIRSILISLLGPTSGGSITWNGGGPERYEASVTTKYSNSQALHLLITHESMGTIHFQWAVAISVTLLATG